MCRAILQIESMASVPPLPVLDTVDFLTMHTVIVHKCHNAWLLHRSHDGTQGKSCMFAYRIMHRGGAAFMH
jgi:hypothetical protein